MMLKKCIVRIMTGMDRGREDSDESLMGETPTDQCLFSQHGRVLNLIRMVVTLVLYDGNGW